MRKLAAITLLALAAACGSPARPASEPPAATTGSPTAAPSDTTEVTLYYLVGGRNRIYLAPERHRVAKTQAIARAALEELVHGTAQDPDHTTPFPRAARINSVSIAGGVATVDWSADVLNASVGAEQEERGIQSVVYTLTEFPTVMSVRFTVDGKDEGTASNGRAIEDWWGHGGLAQQPFRRADSVGLLEPITLWTPNEGDRSAGSVTLRGDATVFEATVSISLVDASGREVAKAFTTALEGAPGRGAFEATVTFTPPATAQTWKVIAFEGSAEDGSVFFAEDRSIRVG
jgi:germination protein M